uniref:BHLH domain-containing protein n=1 Tax=Pinguiococcus pyrenoidosus TaxID=172671 RepID=A0A7R9U539_9STRA|mmetsp:Transcript_15046/g.57082  ORF Transcript_15046/g.57082 Transcript_15046/m.57082 type:complete len:540 (+) Transcript_15046:254-1873(+)
MAESGSQNTWDPLFDSLDGASDSGLLSLKGADDDGSSSQKEFAADKDGFLCSASQDPGSASQSDATTRPREESGGDSAQEPPAKRAKSRVPAMERVPEPRIAAPAEAADKDEKRKGEPKESFGARVAAMVKKVNEARGEGAGEQLDLDALGENEKRRRKERNQREQRRSLKISKKIDELHEILTGSGRNVKPNKSAILNDAHQYIQYLQSTMARKEFERNQFVDVLTMGGNNMLQGDQAGTPAAQAHDYSSKLKQSIQTLLRDPTDDPANEGADAANRKYSRYFSAAPLPCAIAGIDGRILAMNPGFRTFVVPGSGPDADASTFPTLFSLVEPDRLRDVFKLIASVLRKEQGRVVYFEFRPLLNGTVREDMLMCVSLIRDAIHAARLFSVTLLSGSFLGGSAGEAPADGMLHVEGSKTKRKIDVREGLHMSRKTFKEPTFAEVVKVIAQGTKDSQAPGREPASAPAAHEGTGWVAAASAPHPIMAGMVPSVKQEEALGYPKMNANAVPQMPGFGPNGLSDNTFARRTHFPLAHQNVATR